MAQHSFENSDLHGAALVGDAEGVRRALQDGADVNSLDSLGRTVIMCAVAGEHWDNMDVPHETLMTAGRLDVIRILLGRPEISLYTLNAPQEAFNGVTPIGMAAWLNMHDVVRLLVEGSFHTVAVDGMDTHGATSLMYAARDGNLRVVQLLLHHGARPDFRDRNHRTSIQFAMAHPRVLYLCEEILRRHRWREAKSASGSRLLLDSTCIFELSCGQDGSDPSIPATISPSFTSKLTRAIIRSVTSSDLASLHSLLTPLFSCTSSHSSHLLVNAPDPKGWSPIHHCAAVRSPSLEILDTLYYAGADVSLFTRHEHFTPLHCLASSAYVFQDDDRVSSLVHFVSRLIWDFKAPLAARTKEDETCIHIAAEHGCCLNLLIILLDYDQTGAVRELRNSRGLTALEVAKPEFRVAFGEDAESLRSASSLSMRTIRPLTSSIPSFSSFSDLRAMYAQDRLASLNFDMPTAAHQLIGNLRLTSLTSRHDMHPSYLDYLDRLVSDLTRLSASLMQHFHARVGEASDELAELSSATGSLSKLLDVVARDAGKLIQERGIEPINPSKKDKRESEDSQKTAVAVSLSWTDSDASTPSTKSSRPPTRSDIPPSSDVSPSKKKRDPPSDEEKSRTPSKWKAWFKRVVSVSDWSSNTDIQSGVSEDVQVDSGIPPTPRGMAIDNALRTSSVVLAAAQRDLNGIAEAIVCAQHIVLKTNQSISRAEKIISRAVKKRRAMISDYRQVLEENEGGVKVPPSYSQLLSTRVSNASLLSLASHASSTLSVDTMVENDDEETRVIRRLLLRKIEAGIGGALDDLDTVISWLRIVKEAVRGVKRRAYL
ncbi:ankyrin repeat-containing domain protein [Armillaria luteobubalina]|uniref:Ankyrin repeat-containing domain protein n=1 Tax=Armillaria luteobubalina TaxID=153913 RepID=A0AA39TMT0_9AGAR|nr:ankyrin repeat-containing domain protein [Armillaria luteobubalina]